MTTIARRVMMIGAAALDPSAGDDVVPGGAACVQGEKGMGVQSDDQQGREFQNSVHTTKSG